MKNVFLHPDKNITLFIKLKKIGWAGHAAGMKREIN